MRSNQKNHRSREEIIPLATIDSATLMDQPLRQMPFVVDGFLSNGLHLLTGSPKIGRSWLALWISREPDTSPANGMVELILGFMRERDFFEGRPSELADALSAISAEKVTSCGIGRQLKTIQAEVAAAGIHYRSGIYI